MNQNDWVFCVCEKSSHWQFLLSVKFAPNLTHYSKLKIFTKVIEKPFICNYYYYYYCLFREKKGITCYIPWNFYSRHIYQLNNLAIGKIKRSYLRWKKWRWQVSLVFFFFIYYLLRYTNFHHYFLCNELQRKMKKKIAAQKFSLLFIGEKFVFAFSPEKSHSIANKFILNAR